jgi:hypothetical protein
LFEGLENKLIKEHVKGYVIQVYIVLDSSNKNMPSLKDVILAIEDTVNTPDNKEYGIKEILVTGAEK